VALVALVALRQQAPAMAAQAAMAAPQAVPVALGAQASAALPEQRARRKVLARKSHTRECIFAPRMPLGEMEVWS
jgi:hypothetical protein